MRFDFIIPTNYDHGDYLLGLFDRRKAIRAITVGVGLTLIVQVVPASAVVKIPLSIGTFIVGFSASMLEVRGKSLWGNLLTALRHQQTKKKLSYRPVRFRFFLNSRAAETTSSTQVDPSADMHSTKLERYIAMYRPRSEKNLHYTQQFLPIDSIQNGIIKLKNGRYVMILSVNPVNFETMDQEGKSRVLNAFYSWLNVMKGEVQFKITSELFDMTPFIKQLDEMTAQEENEKTKKTNQYYRDMLEYLNRKCVTHRFYMVLSYYDVGLGNDFDSIYNSLMNDAETARNYLQACGNRVNIIDQDSDVEVLLYKFFNSKSSKTEPFEDRAERVAYDTIESYHYKELGDHGMSFIINNYLAPRGIDLSNHDYIIVDGMYYTFFYIDGDSYPTRQSYTWIKQLFSYNEGYAVDLYLSKEDRAKMIKKLNSKVKMKGLDRMDNKLNAERQAEVDDSYYAVKYMQESMMDSSNRQDFFFFNILITISAKTKKELNQRRIKFMTSMEEKQLVPVECIDQEDIAYRSVMPFNSLNDSIRRSAQRNILSDGALSLYPFQAYEMIDKDGVYFGNNRHDLTPIMLNLFDTTQHMSANMFIAGATGSGKTFSLTLLGTRMRRMGVKVFIIAPRKGYEYKQSCIGMGGEYINLSNQCINIMEIRKTASIDTSLLGDTDISVDNSEASIIVSKIKKIKGFFSILYPEITNDEKNYLDVQLVAFYKRYGISTEEGFTDITGKVKPMPTLTDFYEYLQQDKDNSLAKQLISALSPYVEGTYKNLGGHTDVDLDNKYTVIDMSGSNDKDMAAMMYIATDYIYDVMRENTTSHDMLFIDEAWMLLDNRSVEVQDFITELFKVIRGYGGSAVCATQDINDFTKTDCGRAVLAACPTKLILRMEEQQIDMLRQVLNITNNDLDLFRSTKRGNGVLFVNSNKIAISIEASDAEIGLITR